MTMTGRVGPSATRPAAVRRRTPAALPRTVAGFGLVVVVAGTFLPWLRSGTVERNSYTADGLMRRLMSTDGLTHLLLVTWPFLSALCALSVALLILGLARTSWTLAVVCCLAVGIVAVRVLTTGSVGVVGVVGIGPWFTLSGCVIVLAACAAQMLWNRAKRGIER